MTKKQLRAVYKTRRSELSEAQIQNYSLQIANLALDLPIWNYSFFHVFLTIKSLKEVNTEPLLAILSGKDKHIVISKADFKAQSMAHVLLQDNTIIRLNSKRIPEPENGIEIKDKQLEVVFIPLMAFDTLGNRIGYGKGFYDVFLKNCADTTVKIGLSLFEAEALTIDTESHDISLDYCVTPNKIYKF